MSTQRFGQLRRAVLEASHANDWTDAVHEWQIAGLKEEYEANGICVCGKTGLAYLYTIYNPTTDQELFPIGSECINHFGLQELRSETAIIRGLFKLKAAFLAGESVILKGGLFSRALLTDLYENGAFPPNEHNSHNGEKDYHFMLDMFNQRKDPTPAQERMIWALINRSIRPFVLQDERLK